MIKFFTKVFGNPWFGACVISAFISVISFFQINSYAADKNGLNGFWLVIGIAFGVAALFFLYKTSKTSTGRGG